MATWTLSQIRKKVRQVTGRFTGQELTNEQLDNYINQYYQFTFPAEVKVDAEHTYYSFTTLANQAYYDQPLDLYTNFGPPATANNLNMMWYQDPAMFFQANPLQYVFLTPWTGDGSTITFTTSITGFPIYPGTMTVTDNVETFEDTNQTWTNADVSVPGSLGGALVINYSAGTVSVTFATAPANGQVIYMNYVVFAANRPQAILMYNNQFQVWPVPDQSYIINMIAYRITTPLVEATDTPRMNEWGPTIAYGAARDIVADYGETDSYAEITALYKEQVSYILTRTEQNMMEGRTKPTF
jgi:hypothetical protein